MKKLFVLILLISTHISCAKIADYRLYRWSKKVGLIALHSAQVAASGLITKESGLYRELTITSFKDLFNTGNTPGDIEERTNAYFFTSVATVASSSFYMGIKGLYKELGFQHLVNYLKNEHKIEADTK